MRGRPPLASVLLSCLERRPESMSYAPVYAETAYTRGSGSLRKVKGHGAIGLVAELGTQLGQLEKESLLLLGFGAAALFA